MKRLSEFMEDYGFGIELNMNDVFHPAADSQHIDNMEIPGLLHVEEKFGWNGVKAFVGVKRGYEPCWKQNPSEEYFTAKKYIEDNFYKTDFDELLWKEVAVKNNPNKECYFVDFEEFIKKESI